MKDREVIETSRQNAETPGYHKNAKDWRKIISKAELFTFFFDV